MQVTRLRAPQPEADSVAFRPAQGHLADIAEHKRIVELTHKEKAKRKEASIEGNGPF
jgi:hypothetical protein